MHAVSNIALVGALGLSAACVMAVEITDIRIYGVGADIEATNTAAMSFQLMGATFGTARILGSFIDSSHA